MQDSTLLVEIATRGYFQSIQHALCDFPYATDLQMQALMKLMSHIHVINGLQHHAVN